MGEVATELRSVDIHEETLTERFSREGCSCSHGPDGQPCCQSFTASHYREYRNNCHEMTKDQLDMVIMGQMASLTLTSHHTRRHQYSPQERQRETMTFFHQQQRICQMTFAFLHTVGNKRYRALKQHHSLHGLIPRVHGNAGKPRANALNPSELQYTTSFIINYAEANGVVLPGRIPGYKRSDLQLLPSSTTKRGVWLEYHTAAEAASIRAVGYTTCLLYTSPSPRD